MRLLLTAAVSISLAMIGCNRPEPNEPTRSTRKLRTPADPLTPADLDRFLAVVHSHGNAIPEFTPDEEDAALDYKAGAKGLVSDVRIRLRRMFDAQRQGDAWAQDADWSQAFSRHRISGPEFAALVRSISCAVMRVRLKKIDVNRLVTNARAEVKDIVSTMDAIDDIPQAEWTTQDGYIRAQSALRLSRAVALREFAEMLKQVPPENCALVRKYSSQIKPLLPSGGGMDDLLQELQALGSAPGGDVIPAGHEFR
jgi:hypothetical protein